MRCRKRKSVLVLALVVSGGIAFAAGGGACASLAGESLLGSVDFCFLFDCVDGAIGGLLDPCSNVGRINPEFMNRDQSVQAPTPGGTSERLFIDCP